MTYVNFNRPASRSINSFLDSFLNEFQTPGKFFPPVNIDEDKEGFSLSFMVPGRNKEDFKITVDKNILTVSYDKKEESKESDKKTIKKEFTLQNFKRSFNLDEKIQADNIKASYENGILSLLVPKKEQIKIEPKEIAIQ